MSLSPELQLCLLAVALYVQDAVLLLRPDEAIMSPLGRKGWRVSFSSDSARLGGRQLYVPNLLAVHRPVYRGRWAPEPPELPGEAVLDDWPAMASSDRTLMPIVAGIAALQFLALPAALLLGAALVVKLGLLALLYTGVLLAMLWLWRHRSTLPLPPRAVRSLMLECLICPPIAANLVRRLSLATPVRQDVLQLARRILAPADWSEARGAFAERVQTFLDLETPGSTRHAALTRLRTELMETPAEPPAQPFSS